MYAYAFDKNQLQRADERAIDAEYVLPECGLNLLVAPLLHVERHVVNEPMIGPSFLNENVKEHIHCTAQ